MKLFEVQVAGTCPKNWFEFVGLVARTKVARTKVDPATRFGNKNGQLTRWDVFPRLLAGTSLLVCADFYEPKSLQKKVLSNSFHSGRSRVRVPGRTNVQGL